MGIYNILGMEKRHIAKVLAIETVFTAFVSIVGGIVAGILFSKLALMLIYRILGIQVTIEFSVPPSAVKNTVLVFGILYMMTLFYNLMQMKLANPVELLRGSSVGEKEPKTKWLMAILGVVCLGAGYAIAITTEQPMKVISLFFVAVLGWGSMGCAIATVVSEAVCCMLCIIYIKRKVPELNLGKAWFVFDGSLLKQTVLYGWTSAMQQGTVQLGKIGVQAIANTMGVSVMAAYTIVNRIDDFACLPEQNIAHSMTSFMAQNSGAGKKERVRKGFWGGMKIELVYGMIIFLVCFFFAEPIVRLFVSDTDVVKEGVTYLKLISFMYLLPAVTNGIQGYFRGIGDLKITLISSMVNMGVRVLAAFVFVFGFAMKVETFPFACLAGWIAMLITEVPLLVRSYGRLKRGENAVI